MKHLALALILGASLAACKQSGTAPAAVADSTKTQTPTPAPAPAAAGFTANTKLSWKIDEKLDEHENPQTTVWLIADGKTAEFAKGLALKNIEKSDWKTHEIPQNALIAVGGWWAGGGDYYYVVLEGDKLVAYVGYTGEEMAEGEGYQYKVHKTFAVSDFK